MCIWLMWMVKNVCDSGDWAGQRASTDYNNWDWVGQRVSVIAIWLIMNYEKYSQWG